MKQLQKPILSLLALAGLALSVIVSGCGGGNEEPPMKGDPPPVVEPNPARGNLGGGKAGE